MAKKGATTKLTKDKVVLAAELANTGHTITQICKLLRISRSSYYNWAKNNPALKSLMDAEIEVARKKEFNQVLKSSYEICKRHKLKTVKEMFDADGNLTSRIVETKEVDPSYAAIDLYLARNKDLDTTAENKDQFIFKVEDTYTEETPAETETEETETEEGKDD